MMIKIFKWNGREGMQSVRMYLNIYIIYIALTTGKYIMKCIKGENKIFALGTCALEGVALAEKNRRLLVEVIAERMCFQY